MLALGFDPDCVVSVRGINRPLMLPLSHEMPLYRSDYGVYDVVPERIAGYIRQSRGSLRMIDVGANVGDSILTVSPVPGDGFLVVEPHPRYIRYLRANLRGIDNVQFLELACGEVDTHLSLSEAHNGTAAPVVGDSRIRVRQQRLDQVWQEIWQEGRVDFLKIDTDGFDTHVLSGAADLLRRELPWLFYECDVSLTQGGSDAHLHSMSALHEAGYESVMCFDNFGHYLEVIPLEDTEKLRSLLSSQSPDGPIYYHDVLAVPPHVPLPIAELLFR
jgi:FkbM family methyltransferase